MIVTNLSSTYSKKCCSPISSNESLLSAYTIIISLQDVLKFPRCSSAWLCGEIFEIFQQQQQQLHHMGLVGTFFLLTNKNVFFQAEPRPLTSFSPTGTEFSHKLIAWKEDERATWHNRANLFQ